MKPLSVVIGNNNSNNAELLAGSLNHHFRAVRVERDIEAVRHTIRKHKVDVAVVDLELAGLTGVEQLAHEFPDTIIVCTHRLADERMWTEALAAGAVDCCYSSDVRAIVLAASQSKPLPDMHAA